MADEITFGSDEARGPKPSSNVSSGEAPPAPPSPPSPTVPPEPAPPLPEKSGTPPETPPEAPTETPPETPPTGAPGEGPLAVPGKEEQEAVGGELTAEQIGGVFYGIFVGILVITLLVYVFIAVKAGLLSSYNRQFDEQVKTPLSDMAELDRQTQLIGFQVEALNQAQQNNVAWSITLKELQKYSYNKVRYTSFSIDTENKAQIDGLSASYEDLAKAAVALSKSKQFTGIDIVSATQDPENNQIHFSFTLTVKPENLKASEGGGPSPADETTSQGQAETNSGESMTISETEGVPQ